MEDRPHVEWMQKATDRILITMTLCALIVSMKCNTAFHNEAIKHYSDLLTKSAEDGIQCHVI